MTKSDSNPGPQPPEQSDPLSATGMFLRAFEPEPEPTPQAPRPDSARIEAAQDSSPAGPGEFTQMFKSGEVRAPAQPLSANPNPAVRSEPQPAANQEPGEFTRIFVPGVKPSIPPAKPNEGQQRPAQVLPAAKGFSSPGASDSASADSSFSRLFKNAGPPQASSQSFSAQFPAAPPPAKNVAWKHEPVLEPKSEPLPNPSQRSPSSPSATNLLESLSSPRPLKSEPAPYRPEPVRSSALPSRPETPGPIDSGGVTRLIQKLTQEPPAPLIQPPSSPAPPPINSGPGEFTRIISSMGATPAAPPAVPAPVQPAAVQFSAPVAPQVVVPARPSAPAFAPPAVAAPALPAAPRPAPPAPAVPAAKGRFEALVPILLIVNTFLLIVLLLVVIFLLKAR